MHEPHTHLPLLKLANDIGITKEELMKLLDKFGIPTFQRGARLCIYIEDYRKFLGKMETEFNSVCNDIKDKYTKVMNEYIDKLATGITKAVSIYGTV